MIIYIVPKVAGDLCNQLSVLTSLLVDPLVQPGSLHLNLTRMANQNQLLIPSHSGNKVHSPLGKDGTAMQQAHMNN